MSGGEIEQRWGLAALLPTPAETERLLREKYEPILSAEDYALLREKCGLGAVIDGELSGRAEEIGEDCR